MPLNKETKPNLKTFKNISAGLKINSVNFGLHVYRKYLGNKPFWKIYQSIPAEYYKINTAI